MEKWQLAFEDWKQEMKYKEIADKYGVSLGTVKSWASRKWKQLDKEKVATNEEKRLQLDKERLQPKAKVGAPKGNKNAIGNKGGAPQENQNGIGNAGGFAPIDNKNNLKHGIYEKLLYRTLTEEQKQLFEVEEIDATKTLIMEIRLCDIQILDFMQKMKEIEEKQSRLLLDAVSVVTSKTYDESSGKMNPKSTVETTNTIASHHLILQYSVAIERIRKHKIKCLELLRARGIEEESATTNVQIYIPSNIG